MALLCLVPSGAVVAHCFEFHHVAVATFMFCYFRLVFTMSNHIHYSSGFEHYTP